MTLTELISAYWPTLLFYSVIAAIIIGVVGSIRGMRDKDVPTETVNNFNHITQDKVNQRNYVFSIAEDSRGRVQQLMDKGWFLWKENGASVSVKVMPSFGTSAYLMAMTKADYEDKIAERKK